MLIDVRSPAEYAEGHIEGAVNIPVGEIERVLGGFEKDVPMQLYCFSGARAAHAQMLLESVGFSHVTNLGGMQEALQALR